VSASTLVVEYNSLNDAQTKPLIAHCIAHPNIVGVTKIMSKGSIMFHFEGLVSNTKVMKDFCRSFNFSEYRVYECSDILKSTYIPQSLAVYKKYRN